MTYDKRIWKTAAIAVVITIIAGAFVMRLGDWARGLNSEFIVYGQGTGTGGGSTGTGSTTTQTQIIPQVAIGSFDGGATAYNTFIIVSNPSTTTPVTVTANFYTASSSTATAPVPATFGFTTTTAAVGATTGTTSSFTGSTPTPITLAPGAIVTFQSNALATGTSGWGKITSSSTGTSANVAITAGFQIVNLQTNGVISLVGVAASPANMQTFTLARSRNEQAVVDTGFAIVNTGTTAATLTATLRSLSGAILSTQSIPMAPGQQIAEFGYQLFYPLTAAGVATEPQFTGTEAFSMTFDATPSCSASGCAQFAATGLTFAGSLQASYPVIQLK